jgi:dTDP-4-dehydrorhamnose 3,5-epimerase
MKFIELRLKGAFLIEPNPVRDSRGFFVRSFCKEEFMAHGIDIDIKQTAISFNKLRGTLRGMHYQAAPYEEAKIVSCVKGAIYDVIVDLRPNSVTYCDWISIELNEKRHKIVCIPKGFAHGFQTLVDNTIVFYQMSEPYCREAAKGVRWNDPTLGIKWPVRKKIISKNDKNNGLINKTISVRKHL